MKLDLPWALSILLLGAAGASPMAETSSRIDSVTVYRDGASVTRLATVSVQPGSNEIVLSGLPADIGPETLQLAVADGGGRLGQVRLEQVQRRDAHDAEVRRLTEALDRVQRRIRELADGTSTAQLQLKFLEGMAEGYAKQAWLEGARGSADVSSWQQALTVLGAGADQARQRIRDNAAAQAEVEQEKSQLERELATLRGDALASGRVRATLDSERAGSVELAITYYQDSAWWHPAYEARLDSESGRLDLAQNAVVEQASQEPWNDVRITLSTSEPSADLTAPEISSRFLRLQAPQADRGRMLGVAPSSPVEEVIVTAARADATATVTPYAVSYELPGRVSLANETDDAQTFEVARFRADAELATRVLPRTSTDAFLTATFRHDDSAPLLQSAALQVYVDDGYVGETVMPDALPGAEVTLPMGLDRRVALVVQDQGGEQREGGIIGRRTTEVTDFLFEITNRRGGETTVEVLDRYPVSRNEDIEIEVPDTATEPDQSNVDDKPGVVAWRRTLGGGETWRIRHQYEVSYPSDMAVITE